MRFNDIVHFYFYSIAQCNMISANNNSLENKLNMQKQEKKQL